MGFRDAALPAPLACSVSNRSYNPAVRFQRVLLYAQGAANAAAACQGQSGSDVVVPDAPDAMNEVIDAARKVVFGEN
jgi:hypothetical protein